MNDKTSCGVPEYIIYYKGSSSFFDAVLEVAANTQYERPIM